MLQCYLTHTNDGLSVNPQGLMGGRLVAWNPVLFQDVDVHVPPNGGAWARDVFAGIIIDGVHGRVPQDRKPYYVYLFLDDTESPDFFLQPVAGPRYAPDSNGTMKFTDTSGRIGTLIGMICPVDGKIGNVLGAANARILNSSSPFLSVPQQRLSANSGQIGVTFSSTSPVELGGGLPIIACSWAWMEASSQIMGRVADNGGNLPNVFIRPFATSLVDGAKHYGPTIIVQFDRAGQNLPIGGHGVSRAFDDGAYLFGIEGWVSHGACHLNIEHVVKGHL